MLKKLRLDQSKIYEKHLALEEISTMLVSFVKGQSHHLAIGAEQGDVDKWDDLVIQTNTGGYIHVQAKRQTTNFSCASIERDKCMKNKRKGELRKLSPLDEAIKSLGARVKNNGSDFNYLQKEFWLELPDNSVKIKDGLEVRHLRYLCEDQIKSVTTADDLANLAKSDRSVEKIFLWLTTWCDFEDWNHILKAFKILKPKTSGMETDIVSRVEKELAQIFVTKEIKKVRLLILSYLEDNKTFAGAIKPRQLLDLLKDFLRTNTYRWTQYQTDGSNWIISGIHDLKSNEEIERPSVIVPVLWSLDNLYFRSLKIDGACTENCCISESLMRLAIHAKRSFNVFCSNETSWVSLIRTKTGGTIGVASNDLDDTNILQELEFSAAGDFKLLSTVDEQEAQAKELHNQVYSVTFKLVDIGITNTIREMKSGDLRTEVERRWNTWKASLQNSSEKQRKLFSKMLHPNAEGPSISGESRVGLKTVDLIKEALFLLLVVSVCLSDSKNKDSWESVTDELKMTSVGLAFWSGPANSEKKIIEIDDYGVSELIGKEDADILILGKSQSPSGEVFNDDLTGGNLNNIGLISHGNTPKVLITRDKKFKRLIDKGDTNTLRAYFGERLKKYNDEINYSKQRVAS